ncbi:activin receptor type-2B-like [Anneissia japonica]|uniref:activin receptor type-2B-like n=1 Tax=Anneissia japonica TaxID=1529436 RepID=UPI0014258DE0|nr:activin receptor type-2B-like [Anneissia japonica]
MTMSSSKPIKLIIVIFFLGTLLLINANTVKPKRTLSCQCLKGKEGCTGSKVCEHKELEPEHCFTLWNQTSGKISLQGCWTNKCTNTDHCISREVQPKNGHLLFCCCSKDYCNSNFTHIPDPRPSPTVFVGYGETEPDVLPGRQKDTLILTMMYSLLPLAALTLILVVAYWICRRHKITTYQMDLKQEPLLIHSPPPGSETTHLKLIEIKARGRFGAVWKAETSATSNEYVAVKVFPLQDKLSWQLEQEIYSIPHMDHPNLLHFISSEMRGEGLNQELWLITEFHPHGSIYDYLKANTLSWSEMCKIAESIAHGLTFLHEDILVAGSACKPSIAHRDFKSKNILLKNDMTACIADFGLAIKFELGKNPCDSQNQVGTRRYMAPEILEGAVSFHRDAFLRIDMYSCGLVLWELASRCKLDGPVDEYMLPFEEEIGLAPSLEDMQEVVVEKKMRPVFREHWLKHQGMESFCETIEECWDHEAEARLSAGCVEARIGQLSRTVNISSPVTFIVEELPPKESSL